MAKFITKSEAETFELGLQLGQKLERGKIIAIFGDLGAGKTVFVRGLCSAFGIEGVHSPTFTLVNEYEGNGVVIYHFDAYRIAGEDWYGLGFDEYCRDNSICVIEWAENVKVNFDVSVKIEGSGEQERNIQIDDFGC